MSSVANILFIRLSSLIAATVISANVLVRIFTTFPFVNYASLTTTD